MKEVLISLSGIPRPLMAFIITFIDAAFLSEASLAVAARIIMPRLIDAVSGITYDDADPETESHLCSGEAEIFNNFTPVPATTKE